MKAYEGAVGRQVSEDVRLSSNVMSNGQLGGVQLNFDLSTVCTGRDLDPIAKASRGWSARAWRKIFQAYSLKNDANGW